MSFEWKAHLDQRLPIDTLPSPIVPCPSLPSSSGIEVDLKRDDLIGDLLTGTKVRALSHILRQALRDGVTDLITIGEPTSNQCRLVAMLGARHGLTPHLLLRGSAAPSHDDANENVEIMRLFGARLQFLEEDEWRLHGMAAKRLTARLRKAGGKALFLPFGCGGLPGAFGIIDLLREVIAQNGGRFPYRHVLVPTGSGATLFALDLGFQLLDVPCPQPPHLVGISVSQDSSALLRHIDRLYEQTGRTLGHSLRRRPRLTVEDRWIDPSAIPPDALQRIARAYGILPDPLYVLRTFLALERLIATGEIDSSSKTLLLVTGACRTLQTAHSSVKDPDHAT